MHKKVIVEKDPDEDSSLPSVKISAPVEEHPSVSFIRQKIAPLKFRVSGNFPRRVNILTGIIDFKYFFGGFISVFNLAKRLIQEGYNVRMIITDECPFEPLLWRQKIQGYEGLENFFDLVEVIYDPYRSESIECNKKDVFMATSWWTAHIANHTLKYFNTDRFIYLSQEYEPVFYNNGTFYVLSRQSYDFPHYAIFSTEIIRDYHRQNKIGLFKDDIQLGEECSVSFENAVLKFNIDEANIRGRKIKKLLFYARPEEHAARNLFELGVLALSNVIRDGHFNLDSWEFYGIGSLDASKSISLYSDNSHLKLLPRMNLNEYKELLPEFDIGLSLMLSPHPSLVPIEMAAAGMLAVTNTFANKTKECLNNISTNFIAAEPSLEGIEQGLITAVRNVKDYSSRIKGANVNWSQSWEDSFNSVFINKVKKFIVQAVNPSHNTIRLRSSESKEKRFSRAFINTATKNPGTFVDIVSSDDEMYLVSMPRVKEEKALSWYLKSGIMSLQSIEKILVAGGKPFPSINSFLDFGCGYGRVARFLIQEIDADKIWVSDIYKEAVDFQKKYFNVNGFYSHTESSKVEFPRRFEVIYAGSLFSHLPENHFKEWLAALYNVLEEDGIFIFSTVGEFFCPPEIETDPSGFTFCKSSESRSLTTEEYGLTYVTRDWVERLAGKLGISNLYFLEKELCEHQDIYVATKRYMPSLNALLPTIRPLGAIDPIRIEKDGSLFISGWAMDKELGAPAKEVCIYYNGELMGEATLGLPRPDVQKHFGRLEYLNSGWEYSGGRFSKDQATTVDERIIVVIKSFRGVTYLDGMSR